MPSLGLCMIAKNAAATLPHCLGSVRGLVKAMVVADTGSTDGTEQMAQAAGATVIRVPWRNDFSAARNTALAALHTDWVLVLDADEELDETARAWIRRELQAPRADGYVTPVRNYQSPWVQPDSAQFALGPAERHPRAPDSKCYVPSEVCRLYRRDPDIYYIGHVHEQVEHRMLQLGRRMARAGFFIHHFGWYRIDEEGSKRKCALYRSLLEEKLRERPEDALTLMQFGDALCSWEGKHEEGLACFMKAAALNPKQRGVWMHMAMALLRLQRWEAVLVAAGQEAPGSEFAGRCAEIKGEALAALGKWDEARAEYEAALAHSPRHLGITAKLALIETQLGKSEQGAARMQEALAAAEAQALAYPRAETFLHAAELNAQTKQWAGALRCVEQGLAINPTVLALHDLRLRAAVATEQWDRAAEAAARITELQPSPRAVLRHAAILRQSGSEAAASEAVARGRVLFPSSAQLEQAWVELSAGGLPHKSQTSAQVPAPTAR